VSVVVTQLSREELLWRRANLEIVLDFLVSHSVEAVEQELREINYLLGEDEG
jgi:hypothetical protein